MAITVAPKARRTVVSVPRAAISQVCGITDPFCHHASGAKYPDFSSVRTLPYTRRVRTTLASNASGVANMLIYPQYGYQPFTTAPAATGTAVSGWSDFAAYSTIAGVNQYRIVSAGFIVRHIVSPLNSAGIVYIRQYGADSGATLGAVDTATYNATAVSNVPVQDAREIAVVLQHTAQMPQTFYPLATDAAVVTNVPTKGYVFSTVSISGAPASTAIVEIEFVTNYELMFDDASELSQVATLPPASNTVITGAAAHVSSTLSPIISDGVAALGRMFVTKATTALAGYLGGPPAAAITRSALAITVD